MLLKIIKELGRWLAPEEPHPLPLQPFDGRFFAWQRSRNARDPVSPVIVHDPEIGPKMEFVGEKHVLSPVEYDDDFPKLMKRYPPPTMILDCTED
jgi:hypothetical protein